MNNILIISIALFLLYIYLIMPRLSKKQEFKKYLSYLYAHRGLHDNKGDSPENSIKSIELAINNNYGIEFDIRMTKDLKLVVFHDDSLKRVCGIDKLIKDMTYKELAYINLYNTNQNIPLLDEVLNRVKGQVPLIIEIKSEDNDTIICQLLNDRLLNYDGDYVVESFNPIMMNWFKKYNPAIIRGQLSYNFKDKPFSISRFLLRHLMFNFMSRPDFICYEKTMGSFSLNLMKLIRVPILVYTIKNEEEYVKSKRFFDGYIFESFNAK